MIDIFFHDIIFVRRDKEIRFGLASSGEEFGVGLTYHKLIRENRGVE